MAEAFVAQNPDCVQPNHPAQTRLKSGSSRPTSSAIRLLTADLALARSMGEAGRRHVAAHFTWDQVATQMEDLYNSLKH
jgi:glycosyltransferase involved in cell wall biosynthesis